MTVTLTMRHLRADDYALPLLLQLDSGKTMAMNLRGRTLVSGEAYLHLPLREFEMGPTPIGLPEPQRHTLELPNYSDTPLEYAAQFRRNSSAIRRNSLTHCSSLYRYSLDLTELDALNEANYAFPVLQCEAPAGEIPAGGVARVPFRFHPLEAREYAVACPVVVGRPGGGGGGRRQLLLRATGAHPAGADLGVAEEAVKVLLPPAQQISLPSQPLRLSTDRCLFGRLPIGTTARQLVVVRNVSEAACAFEWDTTHPLWGAVASVYPSKGTVAAGAHVCCKVSVHATAPLEDFTFALRCDLYPIDEPPPSPDGAPSPIPGGSSSNNRSLGARSPTQRSIRSLGRSTTTLGGQSTAAPRTSVTVVPPKLRGEAAARAIEEKEERFRENNKIGSPDKEARAARRAARAAEAAAAAELARPPPPQIFLGIRASTEGADALSRSDDFDLTAYYVPRDPPPPPLETAIAPAVPPPPPPARTAPRRRRRRARRRSNAKRSSLRLEPCSRTC